MRLSMRLCLGIFFILCSQWSVAALRDPTRPEGYVENSINLNVHSLELNEVIISSDRRIAVISGHIVKVGDDLAGMRVIAIDANSVQIQAPDSVITLFLLSTPVKSKPSL